MASEIRVGDIGTQLIFEVRESSDNSIVNLSTATAILIKFTNARDTRNVITKTGLKLTDGIDGKCYYTTEAGFLDYPGIWRVQIDVTFPAEHFSSNIMTFKVFPNLPD